MRRVGAYLKSAAVQLPQSHGVAAAAAAAAAASSLSWEASRPCPAVWFGSRGGWRWGSQPQDLLGASAVAAAALAALLSSSGTSDTCGIVGVVGKDNSAREVLLEGLQILRNRGYDSCGLATIDEENNLVLSKFASRGSSADSIDLLRANSSAHDKHSVGIAHTRWATHGGKTDRNAHPHMDYKNRIALVHNGTINNASELRAELEGKGVEFRSETDTEVIAHLVGWELDQDPKVSLKVAVSRALSHCDGTWGLAVMSKDCPSDIVAACQGSPLVIGIGTDRLYLASETSAFSRMTKNFIAMKVRSKMEVRLCSYAHRLIS
jgi:glucosamine--fructose-6-phosphate aminotransferase (isomerizing)